jgi:hypothetical protein
MSLFSALSSAPGRPPWRPRRAESGTPPGFYHSSLPPAPGPGMIPGVMSGTAQFVVANVLNVT